MDESQFWICCSPAVFNTEYIELHDNRSLQNVNCFQSLAARGCRRDKSDTEEISDTMQLYRATNKAHDFVKIGTFAEPLLTYVIPHVMRW